MTRKKDAEEKPTARVQEEAFRSDLPVEGLFVQSTEVSGKESSMFICMSEGGLRSHVCTYPELLHWEESLCFRDTLMGRGLCPADFTSPLFNRKINTSGCCWIRQSMLVGMRRCKSTNPKKSLHPAHTHKPMPQPSQIQELALDTPQEQHRKAKAISPVGPASRSSGPHA